MSDYNICIEYQGKQHYEPILYFGGEDNFELIVKHDKIKKNYCVENNIKLIEISYLDFNNITTILDSHLKQIITFT